MYKIRHADVNDAGILGRSMPVRGKLHIKA